MFMILKYLYETSIFKKKSLASTIFATISRFLGNAQHLF